MSELRRLPTRLGAVRDFTGIPCSPSVPKRVVAEAATPEGVDPKHNWDRPIQAPGHTQVDFEERVDFRRLHAYRLGRTRQALARSGLGALLVFD